MSFAIAYVIIAVVFFVYFWIWALIYQENTTTDFILALIAGSLWIVVVSVWVLNFARRRLRKNRPTIVQKR